MGCLLAPTINVGHVCNRLERVEADAHWQDNVQCSEGGIKTENGKKIDE